MPNNEDGKKIKVDIFSHLELKKKTKLFFSKNKVYMALITGLNNCCYFMRPSSNHTHNHNKNICQDTSRNFQGK